MQMQVAVWRGPDNVLRSVVRMHVGRVHDMSHLGLKVMMSNGGFMRSSGCVCNMRLRVMCVRMLRHRVLRGGGIRDVRGGRRWMHRDSGRRVVWV